MPTNQKRLTQDLFGINLAGTPLLDTISLSTANTWLAFSFVSDKTKTVNKIIIYNHANVGTLANISVSCTLYSDAIGSDAPNAAIEAKTISAGSWVGATSWAEFTGFTTVVTAQIPYWIVLKNLSAVPTTDYPQLRFVRSAFINPTYETPGWFKKHTTDGLTWGTLRTGVAYMRIEYSDGSFAGLPLSNIAGVSGIYSNREMGSVFTTPLNASLIVKGISFVTLKTGTPTGNLQFRIYNSNLSPNPATTLTLAPAYVTSGNMVLLYFATPITLSPNSQTRVVMSETTQSDASGNRFWLNDATFENSAGSISLLPFRGTIQRTETVDATANPVVWTETTTSFMPFALILDTDEEFAVVGGGGGFKGIASGGGM